MKKLLIAFCLLTACSDDDVHDDEHGDEEACEHLAEGPATAVTAGNATGDAAPLVGDDHRRYDIAFAGDATSKVRYQAAAAGEHLFFLDDDVPVSFHTADGAQLAAEKTTIACAAARHAVTLPVGTVFLHFDNTAHSDVGLVVESPHE